MRKNIFVLFYCDKWKSTSSMALCTATTSEKRVIAAIRKGIQSGDFVVESEELSKNAQLKLFKEIAQAPDPIRDINVRVVYAHIECVSDGEMQ